jgi:hypothetical protein
VSWLSEGLKKLGISKAAQNALVSQVPLVGPIISSAPKAPPAPAATNAAPSTQSGVASAATVVPGVPNVALWVAGGLLVLVIVILLARKR